MHKSIASSGARRLPRLLAVGLLSAACGAFAQSASDFAIAPKIGTTGVGLDLSYNVSPSLTARLGWSGVNFSSNVDKDGVKYSGTLKLNNWNALADWFPFEDGGFRVTGGLYFNGNRFDATGRSQLSGATATSCGATCSTVSSGGNTTTVTGNSSDNSTTITYGGKTYQVAAGSQYTVDGKTYTITNGTVSSGGTVALASDVVNGLVNNLNVGANIKWPTTAPYLGIGYGRPFKPDSNWSFQADFGVYYMGNAKVSINSTCSASSTATVDTACNGAAGYINKDGAAQAKATAQDAVDKVKFWPVLTLGVSYRF